jgi:hypothetical protein
MCVVLSVCHISKHVPLVGELIEVFGEVFLIAVEYRYARMS